MVVKHRIKIRKNERRKSQRLRLPLKIKYKWSSEKGALQDIFTNDISGGGIRIRSSKLLRKGDRIKSELFFPHNSQPVEVLSEIVWCKKKHLKTKTYFEAGLKHVKILPRDRERFVFLFCETMLNLLLSTQSFSKR